MDRSIVYTGAVPVAEDWLFPNRAAMVGLAKLSEAVLGTTAVVDGLQVQPTQPTSLAVNVTAGQIYAQAALDSQAFGALEADTVHQIVKQGVALDALRIPINPPGTVGYSQWFLIQAAFQEQDAGSMVLPYYNSANPQQPWSGPNNNGQQQYTRRVGAVVVSVKAGQPAPTGSQPVPEPDAGWVGLGWISVANGQAVVLSQHIVPYRGSNRIPIKLPQLIRGVGLSYTMVNTARNLLPEEAGIVVVDTTIVPAGAELRLPPAGSVPGVPLRFKILGRALTAPSRRDFGWVNIVATGGDVLDQSVVYCGPNDSVELVSDGLTRWHWVSGFGPFAFTGHVTTDMTLPHNILTMIPWSTDGIAQLPAWRRPGLPTRIHIPTLGRYRVTANMAFYPTNPTTPVGRTRASSLYLNGSPLGPQSAQANEGVDNGDGHVVSLVSGPLGLYAGDYLEVGVLQNSGIATQMQAFATWITVKADI